MSKEILTLNLKGEYFNQIKAGTKTEEYRLLKPFWRRRLEGRQYDEVHICLGYPAKDDAEKRIIRPWQGYTVKTIIHPHFGNDPVEVYAIKVAAAEAVPATFKQLKLF
jgi:hypothetical protein